MIEQIGLPLGSTCNYSDKKQTNRTSNIIPMIDLHNENNVREISLLIIDKYGRLLLDKDRGLLNQLYKWIMKHIMKMNIVTYGNC